MVERKLIVVHDDDKAYKQQLEPVLDELQLDYAKDVLDIERIHHSQHHALKHLPTFKFMEKDSNNIWLEKCTIQGMNIPAVVQTMGEFVQKQSLAKMGLSHFQALSSLVCLSIQIDEMKDLLNRFNVDYIHRLLDPSRDQDLISEAKQISPLFPQIYINGVLVIAGAECVESCVASGEFGQSIYPYIKGNITMKLQVLIRSNPMIIFMKGSKEHQSCKFSKQLVSLLKDNEIENFATFNILLNHEVREGLKGYSGWPTYPQIYVHGELIGGLDILKQMLEQAQSKEEFKSKVFQKQG